MNIVSSGILCLAVAGYTYVLITLWLLLRAFVNVGKRLN